MRRWINKRKQISKNITILKTPNEWPIIVYSRFLFGSPFTLWFRNVQRQISPIVIHFTLLFPVLLQPAAIRMRADDINHDTGRGEVVIYEPVHYTVIRIVKRMRLTLQFHAKPGDHIRTHTRGCPNCAVLHLPISANSNRSLNGCYVNACLLLPARSKVNSKR